MSAVERKPAQLVAEPLVVEHKFSDLVGELGALPLALQAAGRHALILCRPRRPDRVGRGSEFVGRHMAHRRGLAGSVRGVPCCSTQVSGRSVCVAGRRAGLCPFDLTPRPRSPKVDRPTWTVVRRPCPLEVVQHVLRAVSRPQREKTVIVVLESPAATHGDEPRIPDLGEDHRLQALRPQLTAFFTSATILASSAAVNFVSAKDVGHMVPSSRFASSLKPNVAYRDLNLSAGVKKQTTLPSLA